MPCSNFWKQRLVPGNAALVVVGAISRSELEALATARRSRGGPGRRRRAPRCRQPRGSGAKLIIVDTPGAAQTQVRVAGLGVARATPDYEAIEVMNTILGGLFTSRINLNLREDKGYTYGAFSAVRGAPRARAVLRRRRHPDRCHRPGRHRDVQRDPQDEGRAGQRRGARARQGQPGAIAAGTVRDVRARRRAASPRCSSTTSASTTTPSTSTRLTGIDAAGRAWRRPEVSGAGPAAGRRGRRSRRRSKADSRS